jgi:hypothetical protein
VHRRFRVPEVYSFGCKDMARSLRLQLGALQRSIRYATDVPNYLEPWYGIGTISSAWGVDYTWPEGQAPAIEPPFESLAEASQADVKQVELTPIGRQTLRMIEFFLEQTKGRLPISLTDTQSPWNIVTSLVPLTNLLMEVYDAPDRLRELCTRAADLLVEFTQRQLRDLGDAVVWPGHGFASSSEFQGLGMSDDNILMLSPAQYRDLIAPTTARAGEPFGGPVFHSCGNWSNRIDVVRAIPGLRMVDAAFGPQTDPQPNPPEAFGEALRGTGTTLNARIVGDADEVAEVVRRLWKWPMKLIVVTYCATPDEQQRAYDRVHEICR